jgi:hypothetical protein
LVPAGVVEVVEAVAVETFAVEAVTTGGLTVKVVV